MAERVKGKMALSEAALRLEEFLKEADKDTHAEWVGGKVVPKMPASRAPQRCNGFLYRIIASWLDYHPTGEVLPPPFLIRLTTPEGEPVFARTRPDCGAERASGTLAGAVF